MKFAIFNIDLRRYLPTFPSRDILLTLTDLKQRRDSLYIESKQNICIIQILGIVPLFFH